MHFTYRVGETTSQHVAMFIIIDFKNTSDTFKSTQAIETGGINLMLVTF